MVYVLSHTGNPLMPTKRYGKVRRMLKNSQARVIKAKPFTIQLTYETTNYTQPVTLGIDAGYQTVGFSAVTEKEELIAGECQLLTGQVKRNTERQQYGAYAATGSVIANPGSIIAGNLKTGWQTAYSTNLIVTSDW